MPGHPVIKRCKSAPTTRSGLQRGWSITSQAYSMGPSDINLFGSLKKHLAGKQFVTDANVKQAVISWPLTLWHRFHLRWGTSFSATLGQMLKCQWWPHGNPVCTICYTWTIEVTINYGQSEFSVRYFLKLSCISRTLTNIYINSTSGLASLGWMLEVFTLTRTYTYF
jgi:hypothetical protein